MYSYSYNHQGPSISRLNQLLSRNELIYQNLKQKLDDINKSDLNIKRNITHIHTNYPPHITSYAQSSIIQKQNIIKSPYAQGSHNLSSINQSKELTFSEGLLQDDVGYGLQKQQRYNEIMKDYTRQRELQLISQRKKLEEQFRMSQVSRSKKNQLEAEQSQRSPKSSHSNQRQSALQSQNERYPMQPSAYFPPNAISKQNKFHKGNQIYLLKIPKTSDANEDSRDIENIATFRQVNQDEVQQKEQVKQTIKTKQYDEITFMQDTAQKQNRPKYDLQISPRSNTQENMHHYQVESQQYRQTLQKIDTIRENIRKEKQSSPQDSGFKYTAVSPKEANLYNELNSNIQKKLSATPQCYLFMPFNKVYRSPILQLKTGGQVLLERKSKTAPINKQLRITDPIKYKFKSVITDQQTIIKLLFAGSQKFDFGLRQNHRVVILGKKDTLKRKLHMGLLAYILESCRYMIVNMKSNTVLRIQHQEVANQDKGKIVQADIDVRVGCERVTIMELERTIQDICQVIKAAGNEQKVLRMTKISMKGQNQWSFCIICSNRIDSEFVRCLGASRICWSANPLLKNYEDLRLTLDSMRHFVSSNYI